MTGGLFPEEYWPMPTVCEGAEGAGAHRVDDHDVPEQRRYTERREEVRCKSIFSNKTRIYFDSLIIAILNIGKKNILINKLS